MTKKSREHESWHANQYEEWLENENDSQGLGVGLLALIAAPLWVLIAYVAWRFINVGGSW